jgi:hypothetical protein
MDRDTALAAPANFRYLVTPIPIARTDKLTRLEKDVWSVLYTYERLNAGDEVDVHLSMRQLGELVGTGRRDVRRVLDMLGTKGAVRRAGKERPTGGQRGRLAYATCWPDWLRDDEYLIRSIRNDVELDDEGEGGVLPPGVNPPRGRGCVTPGRGGLLPPLDHLDQVKDQELLSEVSSTSETPPEEYEEGDPDGESRGATADLVAEKERRKDEREKRRPRRKVAADSIEESNLRTPSKREVFLSWKGKPPTKWSARDVVGYFIHRYVAVKGGEPSEFFATMDAIFKRQCSNVRKYTDRWLCGDPEKAKALVDDIFANAESRGMPLKLGYFFTPANESTRLRLDEPVRSGRAETPAERNDRAAKETDWEARAQAQSEARRRKREEGE